MGQNIWERLIGGWAKSYNSIAESLNNLVGSIKGTDEYIKNYTQSMLQYLKAFQGFFDNFATLLNTIISNQNEIKELLNKMVTEVEAVAALQAEIAESVEATNLAITQIEADLAKIRELATRPAGTDVSAELVALTESLSASTDKLKDAIPQVNPL